MKDNNGKDDKTGKEKANDEQKQNSTNIIVKMALIESGSEEIDDIGDNEDASHNSEQEREEDNSHINNEENISYNTEEKKAHEDLEIGEDNLNNAEQKKEIKVMGFKDDLMEEAKEKEEIKNKDIVNNEGQGEENIIGQNLNNDEDEENMSEIKEFDSSLEQSNITEKNNSILISGNDIKDNGKFIYI